MKKHPWLKKHEVNPLSTVETSFFDSLPPRLKKVAEELNNLEPVNHNKIPKYKHIGVDICVDKRKEKTIEEFKKKNIIEKYKAPSSRVNLGSLEKRGVFKVDNNGTWDLISKCDTQAEAEEEILWRAKEFQAIISKNTKIAEAINNYKGTYVILPIFEIK